MQVAAPCEDLLFWWSRAIDGEPSALARVSRLLASGTPPALPDAALATDDTVTKAGKVALISVLCFAQQPSSEPK